MPSKFFFIIFKGVDYDIIPFLKSHSLFRWNTGGKRHWKFIISEENYEKISESIDASKIYSFSFSVCDWNVLVTFLERHYSDIFYFNERYIYVPKEKMGFVIGKKGWRIKAMETIKGSKIDLLAVNRPAKEHLWWGYGRQNVIVEESICNQCKQLLDDTQKLNSYFYKCNKCNSINYIK